MTNAQIKAAITTKSAELRVLVQLSPEFEAKCVEIRQLREALGNPLSNIRAGVYFSGKGKSREAFLLRA
jgi:hypothetical protein